jgi:hypothetical protein
MGDVRHIILTGRKGIIFLQVFHTSPFRPSDKTSVKLQNTYQDTQNKLSVVSARTEEENLVTVIQSVMFAPSAVSVGNNGRNLSVIILSVRCETSGSAGRKPRPSLLSWPNQPRTLKTEAKKRIPPSPSVPAVLPQLKPNGANVR